MTLPVATLSGTTSSTPGSAAAVGRSRHRPRLAQQHREQRRPRFLTAAVSYASAARAVSATATCAASTAQRSNPRRTTLKHVERQRRDGNGGRRRGCGVLHETVARRQQIEQQSHAGPFAGPKPESMMVPRGARGPDLQAHPSRLEQARRIHPSWSCEFDSCHPLHGESARRRLLIDADSNSTSALLRTSGDLRATARWFRTHTRSDRACPTRGGRIESVPQVTKELHRVCPLTRRASISPTTVDAS